MNGKLNLVNFVTLCFTRTLIKVVLIWGYKGIFFRGGSIAINLRGNFVTNYLVRRMAPVVEKVLDAVKLGEGPHWHAPSQTLYYVDIEGKKLIKYVPATKEHTSVTLGE